MNRDLKDEIAGRQRFGLERWKAGKEESGRAWQAGRGNSPCAGSVLACSGKQKNLKMAWSTRRETRAHEMRNVERVQLQELGFYPEGTREPSTDSK